MTSGKSKPDRQVRPEEIAEAVCSVFGIARSELATRSVRHPHFVLARAVFCAFCRMTTRLSWPDISQVLSGTEKRYSHSTCIDAYKRFWDRIGEGGALPSFDDGTTLQDVVDQMNQKLGTKCLVGHPPRDGRA